MKRILKLVLPAALLINSLCVTAASWYQIEVIVFDYQHPDLDSEVWYENPGLPAHDRSVELVFEQPATVPGATVMPPMASVQTQQRAVPATPNPAELPAASVALKPIPYRVLPVERYRLREDLHRLQLSSTYRPLMHVAWQQRGLGNKKARPVHLVKLAGSDITPGPVTPQVAAPVDLAASGPLPVPVFDGLIRLRNVHLLFLDVDFTYFPADLARIVAAQPGAANNSEQLHDKLADYVRLTVSKRILLNELNYFDHPLFGILVQVTRIRHEDLLPKPAPPESAATAPPPPATVKK